MLRKRSATLNVPWLGEWERISTYGEDFQNTERPFSCVDDLWLMRDREILSYWLLAYHVTAQGSFIGHTDGLHGKL